MRGGVATSAPALLLGKKPGEIKTNKGWLRRLAGNLVYKKNGKSFTSRWKSTFRGIQWKKVKKGEGGGF